MKNFKKVISAVIALALSASTLVSAASFTDVAKTASYAEAVDVLSSLGIVNGYEDGTFRPEGQITRAEAATMIVGALNMTADAQNSGSSIFADVNEQAAWAAGYVNVGTTQKFISGFEDGTFRPQENVTYAQMCVMLTSVAGYGEYAANGGYPKGYTDMAASVGINKGVAAADNTPLTRGQVAQMIYNTLLTPKLGVAEYNLTGNSYSQLDGKNGREFRTLLSEKFGGYAATILIQETPVSDTTLENDEVTFDILKADFWYEADSKIANGVADDLTSYANQTELFAESVDVVSNLKQIGKSIFIHNEDDELVLVYFGATGKTDTKEFDAADYVMQKDLGDRNQYSTSNAKVRFGSKYYNLENSVTIYANGTVAATVTNEADNTAMSPADAYGRTQAQYDLDTYLGSALGTITLLDDGQNAGYEVIMIDVWNVAKVLGVEYENGQTVVSMTTKNAVAGAAEYEEIIIDDEYVEEGKTKVAVEKNGQEVELASLAKDDIIAYKTDIGVYGDTDITNPKTIEILATNDTAAGKVTGEDPEEETVVVGGTAYEAVVYGAPSLTIGETYTLTLDPFGRIYDAEKDGSADLYAIALDVTSDDYLKLVLADGTAKSYPIEGGASISGFGTNTKTGVDTYLASANAANRVIKYKVRNSTGEIMKIEKATASENAWSSGDEFKSRTNRLGSSEITSATPVIDATRATADLGSASSYKTFNTDSFKDGSMYKYVSFKSGTYTAFVVIGEVGTKINSETRFAVVRKAPVQREIDGDMLDVVTVLYNGDDEAELTFNENVYYDVNNDDTTGDALAVGDAFFYEVDAYGYVEKVFRVWDGSTFTNLHDAIEATKANDHTTALVAEDYIVTDPTKDDAWDYTLLNSAKADIQLVEGYVVPGDSGVMTFAQVESNLYKIDTTKDHAADSDDGIAIFAVASDVQAYLYNVSNTTIVKAYDKFSVKKDVSVLASTGLAKYLDNNGIYGVGPAYTTDMAGDANYAIALIVDEVVVEVYVIK